MAQETWKQEKDRMEKSEKARQKLLDYDALRIQQLREALQFTESDSEGNNIQVNHMKNVNFG